MKSIKQIAILAVVAMVAVTCITGCDKKQPATNKQASLTAVKPAGQANNMRPAARIISTTPAPAAAAPVATARPTATATVKPAPAASPASATAAGTRMYTVKKGDTLWSIATKTYGNGQRWQDIAKANPGLNANSMRVGQKIVLP